MSSVILAAVLLLVVLFICWSYISDTTDKGYNKHKLHGRCEARLGCRMGMMVTCGKKTNLHDGTRWYCSKHPPSGAYNAEEL